MKLANLRLQNFRSCSDVAVAFDDYTCLVGQNGAGKSTILTALNILFRHSEGVSTSVTALTEEDFCNRDTSLPIVITATFDQLSETEAQDFQSYVRHGQLVVTARATWDAERRAADVKQYGARLVMKAFAPFFESAGGGTKVAELKELYRELREQFPGLAATSTKADMEQALRDYEEAHRDECELLDSEDQFYGYTKGANRLGKYIQWVYIPAVKDAASEQDEAKNTALGELLQRTLRPMLNLDEPLKKLRAEASRQYAEIVAGHQDALQAASNSLENRLRSWAHAGARVSLQWNADLEKAVSVQSPMARAKIGDDEFIGDVPRMGHGLQRAFIVSVLQELAESGAAEDGPRLLLGFEEPELYQHPPQARHLARVLEDLAADGAQVVVTTHSPYFISGRGFERVRMVRKDPVLGQTVVTAMTHERVSARIGEVWNEPPLVPTSLMAAVEQILQPSLNELFFCGVPVLVEGVEDVAFLGTYLKLTGRWPDFRQSGCHFVVVGGKDNMARPLAMAEGLSVPAFAVFDADGMCRPDQVKKNRALNLALLRLTDAKTSEAFPGSVLVESRAVAWPNTISDAVTDDVGQEVWRAAERHARTAHGYGESVRGKNGLLLAAILEQLWDEGVRVPVLDRACEAILVHARGLTFVSPPADVAGLTEVVTG